MKYILLKFQATIKHLVLVCILILSFLNGIAQDVHDLPDAESTGMRTGGKIFVVIGVLSIIWIGFGIYLFLLEKRITKIEKHDLDEKKVIL